MAIKDYCVSSPRANALLLGGKPRQLGCVAQGNLSLKTAVSGYTGNMVILAWLKVRQHSCMMSCSRGFAVFSFPSIPS